MIALNFITAVTLLAVISVPGAPLLMATGVWKTIPPLLRFPATLVVTLTVDLAMLFPLLLLGQNLWWFIATKIMISAIALQVARNRKIEDQGIDRQSKRNEGAPRVSWLRRQEPEMLIVLGTMAVVSVFSLLIGGRVIGDAIAHSEIALKLVRLGHPTLANIGFFRDGGANPAYYIPLWHAEIATVSRLTGVLPVAVMGAAPAVLTPLAIATAAGVGRAVFRSASAGALTAIAFLLIFIVGDQLALRPIQEAAYPREITTDQLMPFATLCMFLACWRTERTSRRMLLTLGAFAMIDIGILHVSYVPLECLIIGGYGLMWMVSGPWDSKIRRSHWTSFVIMAISGILVLAALAPVLKQIQGFGGQFSAQQLAAGDASHTTNRGGTSFYDTLFVGHAGRYRLRVEELAPFGVFNILGGIAVWFAFLRRRAPSGWLILGPTALVSLLVLNSLVFPSVIAMAGISQVQRFWVSIPTVLAMGLAGVVFGSVLDKQKTRSQRRRLCCAVAAIGGIVVAYAQHGAHESMYGVLMPNRGVLGIYNMSFELILFATAVWWVTNFVKRWRTDSDTPSRRRTVRARGLDASAVSVQSLLYVVAVAMVITLPALPRVWHSARTYMSETTAHKITERGVLALVPLRLQSIVRELPAGTVVAADAATSFYITAVAPVYLVSGIPVHTPDTKSNRVVERMLLLQELYASKTTDIRRLQILQSEDVKLLIVPDKEVAVIRFAKRQSAELSEVPKVPGFHVYRI